MMVDWVELGQRWIPRRVRYGVQRYVSFRNLKLRRREREDALSAVVAGDENPVGSPVRFGIIRNAALYHTHFTRACLEVGVPFRVLDLFRSDWLQQVEGSGCEVLLVWPDAVLSMWNTMIKERMEVLARELGYATVPTLAEIWMYEDKRRMMYWLAANRVPHPRTWVFYDRKEAAEFCAHCDLPIVFKTAFGAASTGVFVLRSRRALASVVRRAFSRGVTPGGTDWRDRQWGSVLLQEYLADVREWRMVRIGDAFLCRLKAKVGDFHSGSGLVSWARPSERLLEFAREVTERGGFRSMDVDIFETTDGRLLVNELQAVFGPIRESNLERGSEHRGRWHFDRSAGTWTFEAGDFYRNACANERVLDALARGLRRGSASAGSGAMGWAAQREGAGA